MTKEETTQLLTVLMNQYPQSYQHLKGQSDIDMFINIWYECLKSLPYKEVQKATLEIIQNDTCKFAPPVAEIIQTVKNNQKPSDVQIEIKAYKAFEALCKFARSLNYDDFGERLEKKFLDLDDTTIELFNRDKNQAYNYSMSINQTNKHYLRKEFVERYKHIEQSDHDRRFKQLLESKGVNFIE